MDKFVTCATIALFLLTNNHLASGTYTDHKVRFKSKSDQERYEEFFFKVVSVGQKHLTLPQILRPTVLEDGMVMPADTPREHLDVYYHNPTKKVLIGILVENYSKYRLEDPRTSGLHTCRANTERNQLLSIEPGHSEYLVVDNDGTSHRGVCGSVSWQIFHENGSPVLDNDLGSRFTITYDVRYGGTCGQCGKGRENSFSMSVMRTPLNATYHWAKPEAMDNLYYLYHKGNGAVHQSGGEPKLGLFDNGRYLTRGQMECGCKPLLVVQFMPGPDWRKMVWTKNDQVLKAMGLSNSSQGNLSTGTGIPFLVIVVGSACASFLVLVLGFCGIRKCKEARNPRYDSAPIN